MPLPSITKHGAKQCTAKSKRTGLQFKNPAAYGCRTCYYHGARKPESIKRGEQHPNYVHGERSKDWMKQNSTLLCELRDLESLGYATGMMSGPRIPGRKPKS